MKKTNIAKSEYEHVLASWSGRREQDHSTWTEGLHNPVEVRAPGFARSDLEIHAL